MGSAFYMVEKSDHGKDRRVFIKQVNIDTCKLSFRREAEYGCQ
jgi:hypothetical protein